MDLDLSKLSDEELQSRIQELIDKTNEDNKSSRFGKLQALRTPPETDKSELVSANTPETKPDVVVNEPMQIKAKVPTVLPPSELPITPSAASEGIDESKSKEEQLNQMKVLKNLINR